MCQTGNIKIMRRECLNIWPQNTNDLSRILSSKNLSKRRDNPNWRKMYFFTIFGRQNLQKPNSE